MVLQLIEKEVEHVRVKDFASLSPHDLDGFVDAEAQAVGPVADQGVETVSNSQDAGQPGYLLATQPPGITRPVPVFVMREDYLIDGLGKPHCGYQRRPDCDVSRDLLKLLLGQAVRLIQDEIRNTYFSYIVEHRG